MKHAPDSFLGLIPETPRPTDYIAGVSSPLPQGVVVMPDGKWTRYASKYERQNVPFETFNCTAFSLTNALEMWLNFLIETNQLPQTHLDFLVNEGYIDDGGGVNFSERALGSWAGTNENGNRLTTVVDTARKMGLASNKLWPFGGNDVAGYYATPTKEVEEQAARFLQYFQINYEWFYNSPGTYADAMKECPLWVALVTCGGWNNPPVPWCGVQGTNHAVTLTEYDQINDPVIVDHYPPYVKQLALDYQIPYALKVFIKAIKPQEAKPMYEKVVKQDGKTFGVRVATPNGDQIIYATGEEQWKSWSKADSYQLHTVNNDDSADFTGCVQLPW